MFITFLLVFIMILFNFVDFCKIQRLQINTMHSLTKGSFLSSCSNAKNLISILFGTIYLNKPVFIIQSGQRSN